MRWVTRRWSTMRWLINYLRSCFCRHDWEFISKVDHYNYDSDKRPYKQTYVYRCTICGYMQITDVK